jgi:hypothetical protein
MGSIEESDLRKWMRSTFNQKIYFAAVSKDE